MNVAEPTTPCRKVRLIRRRSGLTRNAFCRRYGCSKHDLYRAENGDTDKARDILGEVFIKESSRGKEGSINR